MHFTTFFTILALGFGAAAQDTVPVRSTETSTAMEFTATPEPLKTPGNLNDCWTAEFREVGNSEGACKAVGGKYKIFRGCCILPEKQASWEQGCRDNGGVEINTLRNYCEMA